MSLIEHLGNKKYQNLKINQFIEKQIVGAKFSPLCVTLKQHRILKII